MKTIKQGYSWLVSHEFIDRVFEYVGSFVANTDRRWIIDSPPRKVTVGHDELLVYDMITPILAGRVAPYYRLKRHSQTWGFILENCWAVYTSWPMPLKEEDDPELRDENLSVSIEMQYEEAAAYNYQ